MNNPVQSDDVALALAHRDTIELDRLINIASNQPLDQWPPEGEWKERFRELKAFIEFGDLITELLDSETLQKQWAAFLSKLTLSGPETFAEVLALIGKFLSPVFSSINDNKALSQKWVPPGQWRNI